MKLNQEDVKHLAELARLDLSEPEAKKMSEEFGSILGYVERIQKVDTGKVEPFTMPAKEDWRPDVAFESDEATRELILSNFPGRTGDLLQAPGVFENPKR